LGAGSAALAAAGLLSAKDLAAQEQETPNKAKTDRSASDPGPGFTVIHRFNNFRNVLPANPCAAQNRDNDRDGG
jgi:hypothetical protein